MHYIIPSGIATDIYWNYKYFGQYKMLLIALSKKVIHLFCLFIPFCYNLTLYSFQRIGHSSF